MREERLSAITWPFPLSPKGGLITLSPHYHYSQLQGLSALTFTLNIEYNQYIVEKRLPSFPATSFQPRTASRS
jgi:hypothetical protein